MDAAAMAFGEGDLDQAAKLYTLCLTVLESEDFPQELKPTAMAGLARVYRCNGRLSEAQALLNEALALIEASPEPVKPELIRDYFELALVFWSMGRKDESRFYADKASTLIDQMSEPLFFLRASIRALIAYQNGESGHFVEAERLVTAARDELESLSDGKRSRPYAELMLVSGLLAIAQNNLAQGEERYNAGLELLQLNCGAFNPVVATWLDLISDRLRKIGEIDKAALLSKQGDEIRKWRKERKA